MESEYQTVDDKVLLCEPLDQGLEDGQLIPDAGGHDVPCHEAHLSPCDTSTVIRALYWALGADQTDSGSPGAPEPLSCVSNYNSRCLHQISLQLLRSLPDPARLTHYLSIKFSST